MVEPVGLLGILVFQFPFFIHRQTTGNFKPVFLPVMFVNEVSQFVDHELRGKYL